MADRLLRVPEVCKMTGLSRQTIWRLQRAGKFPRRVLISRKAIGWYESDVREWIIGRARAPRASPGAAYMLPGGARLLKKER
jgi:prophage regulatory protein